MQLWIRFAIRNMTRNVRRSLLTAATVLAGTALVTLAMAWVTGIFGSLTAEYSAVSGHLRLVDTDFATRESVQPLYENIADVDPALEAIRRIPGVVDAEPRITTGVLLSIGDEIGENFAPLIGATDVYYRKFLKGPEKMLDGVWLSGAGKEAVLGRKIAGELKAKVGGKVLLMGQTQDGSMSSLNVKVVGISGGDGMMDQQVFISLEDARYLADMPGGALEVLVWGATLDRLSVGPMADALRAEPALKGITVQPWYERQPLASSLPMIDGMKTFIRMLIVFIAALAIFNTMTMSVLERTTEIGVLRAMGLTRPGAVGLFVLEGMCIGLVGGIAGTLLGAIPAWYLELHGFTMSQDVVDRVGNLPLKATLYADINANIMLESIVLGLVIAVVGALLPALRAASIRPVVAMRARR